jgi:hypothetical protein
MCGSSASPGDGSASVFGVVDFALSLAGGGVLDGVSPELADALGLAGVSSLGLPKLGRLEFEGAVEVSDAEVLAGELAAGAFAGVLSFGLPKLGRLGSAGALDGACEDAFALGSEFEGVEACGAEDCA